MAIARGEQDFYDPSGVATATEACKSNALMRCCKDLGIASELWYATILSHSIQTLNLHLSGTPGSSASSNRNIASKYLPPIQIPRQSKLSCTIFLYSIPDNALQEKAVETQGFPQVLLSVAGVIDSRGAFPVLLTPGQVCKCDIPIHF